MMVYAVDVFENREDDLVRKVFTRYFDNKEAALEYYKWYNDIFSPANQDPTYADGPYEL